MTEQETLVSRNLVTGVRVSRDWSWSIPLIVTGVTLALLAVGRLAIGLEAIGESQQLDYGEPIVYGTAARLITGQPLYQPLDRSPFTVTSYTPLYYVLVALGQSVAGPGFGPGRAISLVAGVATSLCIAWLVMRHARSIWAGIFAALLFGGLGFSGTVPWFALYRVDVLAVALSLGAIVVLDRGTSTGHLVLAGVLAGLAVLTKQSYVAATLAGTVWLWSLGPRRAVLFGGIAAVLAAAISLAEELATGAFVANAVVANANPFSLEQVAVLLTLFAQTLFLPVAIASAFVVLRQPWRVVSSRLLVVYWLATALSLVGVAKFGASYNYWIEFAASTAVLATVGLWAAARGRQSHSCGTVGRVLTWLFAANVLLLAPASLAATARGLGGGAALTGLQPANHAEFQQLLDFVRTTPGAVLADPADVVVLSGRQVLLEPVIFSIRERQGQWDPEPLARRICAGEVSLLVLGFPMDAVARYAPYGEPWWPPRIMQALQDCMRPAGQRAGRFLYIPASS